MKDRAAHAAGGRRTFDRDLLGGADPRFEDVAEQVRPALPVRLRGDARATSSADTMGGGVGLIDFDGDGWLDVYFVNGCPLPVDRRVAPAPEQALPQPGRRHVRGRDRAGRGRRAGLRHGLRRRRLRQRRPRRPVRHRARIRPSSTATGATARSRTSPTGRASPRPAGRPRPASATSTATATSTSWSSPTSTPTRPTSPAAATRRQADPLPARTVPGPARPPLPQQRRRHLHRRRPRGGPRRPRRAGPGPGDRRPRRRRQARPLRRQRRGAQLPVPQPGRPASSRRSASTPGSPTTATAAHGEHGGRGRGPRRRRPDRPVPHQLPQRGRTPSCRNLGGGLFADATRAAGLDAPSRSMTGFGAAALDADNDGLLDLFVANGHVDDQPWINHPMAQLPHSSWPGSEAASSWRGRTSRPTSRSPRSAGGGGRRPRQRRPGRPGRRPPRRARGAPHNRTKGGTGSGSGCRLQVGPDPRRRPRDLPGRRPHGRRWLTSGTSYLAATTPGSGSAWALPRTRTSSRCAGLRAPLIVVGSRSGSHPRADGRA